MCDVFKRERSEPIEKRLDEFLAKHELTLSNNTDIVSLCKKLNLSTLKISLADSNLDGFILVNEKYRAIAINELLQPLDARFLIAHELSHYITEVEGKQPTEVFLAAKDKLAHGAEKPSIEHDMDYLAAAILVPRKQFQEELKILEINYKNLHTEEEVKKSIAQNLITFFANRYRVREQLIIRRIAEVSYYA